MNPPTIPPSPRQGVENNRDALELGPPRTALARERAQVALLTHPTVAAAAKAAGVGVRTLKRWLRDPVFLDAYRAVSRQAVDDAVARLRGAAGAAVDVLRAGLRSDNEALRLRAAGMILDNLQRIDLGDLADRVSRLETATDDKGGRAWHEPN